MTRRGWLLTMSAGVARTAVSPLPRAIASLPNRRAEAHPITRGEREGRLERARALMQANRLHGMVLVGGTSLEYFTGVRWGNSERLFAFILPRAGNPFYICPAFEQDRLQEQTGAAPLGRESKILTWQEDDDPYRLMSRALAEVGVRAGRVGIEERVPFVFADGIRQAAPGLELASATPVTAGCRMIKSEAELKLMQLANAVTLQVYEAAWKSLEPGM